MAEISKIRKRADLPPMERAVSDTLDEWLVCEHGVFTSWAAPEDFLFWLEKRGYVIVPKEMQNESNCN